MADTHFLAEKRCLLETITDSWMNIHPHCQRQKCRPTILVSRNIKPCPHWRLQCPNSATIVAENGDNLVYPNPRHLFRDSELRDHYTKVSTKQKKCDAIYFSP